ncbi:disintegrin and metalloproteinase domain-containing protein 18, partial [Suncus etruscus]|uniref:disintegrin and metalloproteinase domain-containing protein 18 n=1 Tax=Suncus etruscus TaxID=109475 RepID=UPI0021100212
MLFLFALLTELVWLNVCLDSEKLFLHITVPQKIKSNESENPEKQVIYNITIDEKPHTLLLKKHSFLSNNFLVYTYNETGYLHYESKYFKRHCHYQGYIEDIPNSHASLNICSGLRGFIQYENLSYGIQPLELSARFEHIIYQVRIKNANSSMLAENDSYIQHKYQSSKVFLKSQKNIFSKLLPLHLEMHITVEKALYEYLGSESMIVTQKIIQIFGLVNTIFSQFKLSVILSSLELWSDKNQLSTNGEPDNLLQRFLAWKNDSLILPQRDITLLLIYRKHPKYVGATIPHSICNNSYNADIAVYPDAVTLEEFSFIVSQLLGLKIGLTYNDKNCIFSRAVCIMNYEAMYLSGLKTFSNDSMTAYKYFISKLEPKCLQKLSKNTSLYQTHPVCGNGILEHNEECDCGSKEECQFKMCCDYNTCKLKNSAKCGSGPCCTTKCEIAVAGTVCRRSIDEECDFTEYCNGTSSNCVPDTYALNGKLCSLGAAYCYNGQCQTTDNQCTMIFGKGVQGAPYACFEEINFQQDEYRNCGFKNLQPLPCKQKDVLCGKLACVWPHQNIYKSDIQSVLYSYTQDYMCMSITAGSSLSADGKDYAYVADGTVCGPNMYCLNRTCKEAQLTTYSCNATTKCKGNGICNNLGNCHCFPGYQPPYCELQIDSPGGSIDDGNIQKSGKFLNKGRAYQKNWLILSFYIVLPFFIIFIITIK